MSDTNPPVLAVDLDGTLIASDMLHESFWATLGSDRGQVLRAAARFLTGGRAALKATLAKAADVDVALLPDKSAVLEEIRARKAAGAHVVLATASDQGIAQAVADHLGIFDEVMASDGETNLKARAKAAALAEKFGKSGFAYIGDSAADLPVWSEASEAISVDAPESLKNRISADLVTHLESAAAPKDLSHATLRALRPHQWLKNLLVFVPMLLAHDLSVSTFLTAFAAFVAFSLVASSVYVLNDLLDLSADRAHPRKKDRPFASGALPLLWGLLLAPGLLLAGVAVGGLAGPLFLAVLAFYYLCTLAYSLALKQVTVIDICMLAGLYTLRVIAGAAATGNAPSVWLLGFSIFFFLALAAVKRQAELVDLVARGDTKAAGRGYLPEDLPLITMMGLSAGYVSVLVAGLYLTSDAVAQLYSFPSALWGICAVLIYWLSRIVMLTHRSRMHDDPIVFAVTDRVSLFCGVAIIALAVLAARLPALG
ncbi:MAG: UbiA family prenyltransferase [Alphaproteobacteria bacterium]|nr:UbiA family prenyltransferase [Alphaproteobacteria bacterium]